MGYEVLLVGVGELDGVIDKLEFAEHSALLTDFLGESTGVDAFNSRHVLLTEPLAEALLSVPVAIVVGVVGDYDAGDVNLVGLEKLRETRLGVEIIMRHAIVANEWIGEDQDLASVGRIGEALWVARHCGVEDHLASTGVVAAERDTLEGGAVFEHEPNLLF